jgi:hypothetical protein
MMKKKRSMHNVVKYLASNMSGTIRSHVEHDGTHDCLAMVDFLGLD